MVRLKPWPLYGAVVSRNFIVYYDNRYIQEGYAQRVADFFENTLDYYKSQGYLYPAYADTYRVSIEIKKEIVPASALGFFVPRPPVLTFRNPYFEMQNQLPLEQLRGVSSHELFHFIQLAYDKSFKTGRWLKEATATWVEDEVTPLISKEGSYLYYEYDWYDLWSQGFELNRDDRKKSGGKMMPYGSAFFFKYLTEHHPKGSSIIKEIWESIREDPNVNPIEFVRTAVGDFNGIFTNFCVALNTKTLSPYDFKRGAEIAANLSPKGGGTDWRYSARFSLNPLSAHYFFFWPPDDLKELSNLHILLKNDQRGIQARVIKAKLGTGEQAVEEIHLSEPEKIVSDYGKSGIDHVVVAVCSPSSDPQNFDITAFVEKKENPSKEEKSGALKKFFVESAFARSDAEMIASNLEWFDSGEPLSVGTSLGEKASYGILWGAKEESKRDRFGRAEGYFTSAQIYLLQMADPSQPSSPSESLEEESESDFKFITRHKNYQIDVRVRCEATEGLKAPARAGDVGRKIVEIVSRKIDHLKYKE